MDSITLRKKTIKSFYWVGSSKIVNQLISWIITIVIARLLMPSDYGLIGMAATFTGLIRLFNEFGIGDAIIQKKNIDDEQLSSAFWFIIFIGLLIYLVSYFFAPIVNTFYNQSELTIIIRVIALGFIIGSFRVVPFSLLIKELDFDKKSKAEVISNIISGILTLILALLGLRVWSLVLGSVFREFLFTVLCYVYKPWFPQFQYVYRSVKSLMKFGFNIVGSRISWYLYSNADFFIIGKILGEKLLGYYAMAFQLATLPVDKISAMVKEVSFSLFSQTQSNHDQLKAYFIKITRVLSFITFPIFAGLVLVADDLILLILSEKWTPMIIPFKILCGIGIIKSIDTLYSPILNAIGRPEIDFKLNLLFSLLLPVAFYFGAKIDGINGVAYAWLIFYLPLAFIKMLITFKNINIRVSEYFKQLSPAILNTFVMIISVIGLRIFFLASFNMYLRLSLSVLSGGLIYIIYLFVFNREFIHEMKSIILNR